MFQNVSFPRDIVKTGASWSHDDNDYEAKIIEEVSAPECAANETASLGDLQDVDGSPRQSWVTHTIPPIEFAAAQAVEIRTNRNELLSASDWTQVADAPVDQVVWAEYRQALRDIPQQSGFPSDVTWPETP